MIVIAFGHRSGMGKDTAAKYTAEWILESQPVADVKVVGFADHVKIIAHDLYGWAGLKGADYYEEHREARHEKIKALDKTPIQIWISLANSIRDNVYARTWADIVLRKYIKADYLLITDLRFQNEIDAINQFHCVLVKVNRDDVSHIASVSDAALEDFDGWDYKLNNLTEAQVRQECKKIVEGIIFG